MDAWSATSRAKNRMRGSPLPRLKVRWTEAERLLLYDSAGDSVAGIAGWISLHVIGFGVNYDSRSAVSEQRVSVAAEIYIFIRKPHFSFSVGAHCKVGHVTRMVAIGTVKAVLFAVRIKVRTRGFEIGHIAFRILVEVDGVLARRKIFEVKLQAHTAFLVLIQDHSAHAFPLRVL